MPASISKAEIGLWTVGGVTLAGAYILRERLSDDAFRNARIFAGGALVTGAAMTGGRLYAARKRRKEALAGAMARSEIHAGGDGQMLSVWDDDVMELGHRVYLLQDLVAKSIKQPEVRKLALAITGNGERDVTVAGERFHVYGRGCPARDDYCEAQAIFDFVANPDNVRYTGDVGPHALAPGGEPEPVDQFQAAHRTLEFHGGDCLPVGTRLLTENRGEIPIERVRPGERIWGRDSWTEVTAVWIRGVRSIAEITLSTNRRFEATLNHKVYVVRPNSNIDRIRVADVMIGMQLLTPLQTSGLANVTTAPTVKCFQDFTRSEVTYDLTTADHYVYLPHAGVTVSNCDDHSVLTASLGAQNGFSVRFRITSNYGDTWDHIYTLFGTPKLAPTKWIAMDTTLGQGQFNKQAPRVRQVDYVA